MLRVTHLSVGSCRVRAFAAGLPDRGRVDLPALVTLIDLDSLTILFDCGYGPAFFDATRRFPARAYRLATPVTLRAEERLAAQLPRRPDLILLSHMHGDHVAGLMDLPRDIPVRASGAAIAHLRGLTSAVGATLAACPLPMRDAVLARDPQPLEEAPALATGLPGFPDGRDILGTGEVIAIPLPGHGVGQTGLWLPAARTFLIADAAYSRSALRDGRLPPRPVLSRLGDARAYRDTFARLQALMRARPEITLVPSHCREVLR
ncbi:MBL fold metallo-hydrolase [Mesobaculum littorinae]|uniref:MBL fold metallo-hydrolase n=1 Tax=Mesobaculum littorinae TaxID=2486419 RepID=A0A438AF21_9RHOB|nr:MBL fold metallo-hydrolase [Mesobaculum littorinae]RVV97306.1 MBL fold metallo-hydrolase [Mesobaculum littorinae]